jgi:hypothetical protein
MRSEVKHARAVSAIAFAWCSLLGCAPDSPAAKTTLPTTSQSGPSAGTLVMYPSTGVELWDPVVPAAYSAPDSGDEPEQLTEDETAKAIAVAKTYLGEEPNSASEHEYSVSRDMDGYRVFIQFVTRDEQGKSYYTPGGHCLLYISADWKITSMIGGA